jgi:uncharacterized membrane protein
MADRTNPKESNMIESILTLFVLLMTGVFIGIGIIIAVLYFGSDND